MIYYRPRKEKQHYMIFVNYHYILGKSRERIPKKSSCNAEKTACGTMSAEASTSEKQSGFSATLLSQRKSPEKEKKRKKSTNELFQRISKVGFLSDSCHIAFLCSFWISHWESQHGMSPDHPPLPPSSASWRMEVPIQDCGTQLPRQTSFSTHNLFWLVISTPLKNISQLGLLFQIYGKPPTSVHIFWTYPISKICPHVCQCMSLSVHHVSCQYQIEVHGRQALEMPSRHS